jgi:hypothetical protein
MWGNTLWIIADNGRPFASDVALGFFKLVSPQPETGIISTSCFFPLCFGG